MNHRREFLRNITLAIAASLLPKILQPIASEIEEEIVPYMKNFAMFIPKGLYEDSNQYITVKYLNE